MRTNSVISDPEPLVPTPVQKPDKNPEPQNDFDKLANSSDYPQFRAYLEQRKKYFGQFTPDGTPVEKLTKTERINAWGNAVVVIRELEMLQNQLDNYKRKK
jgi:hypothetical protein